MPYHCNDTTKAVPTHKTLVANGRYTVYAKKREELVYQLKQMIEEIRENQGEKEADGGSKPAF